MFQILTEAFALLCALAVLTLAALALRAALKAPRTGATPRTDRREVVILQWRRRQALRALGTRWVLDPSQPRVRWGYHK